MRREKPWLSIEDLEDLRDLETAIAETAGKPLIPWEKVKAELELE